MQWYFTIVEIPDVKNNYVSESKGQWEATDCRWLLDQIGALEELEAQGHKKVAHVAPCYRHESVPCHCNKLCQFSRLRSWDRAAFTDETCSVQMIQLLAEVIVPSVAQSWQQWVWHSGWRRQIFCRGHGPLFATSQQRPNDVKTLQSVPNDLLKEGIHQTLIRDQKDRYNYGIICIIYIMSTTSIGSLFDNCRWTLRTRMECSSKFQPKLVVDDMAKHVPCSGQWRRIWSMFEGSNKCFCDM